MGWLSALYVRFVGRTTRWKRIGIAEPAARFERGESLIVCFWHNRLMVAPLVHPARRRSAVMVSHHGNGRLIGHAVSHFGLASIAGSSAGGGEAAALEAGRHLERGETVVMAPDGPRGPRMRAAPGALRIAQLSSAPIYPLAVSTTRRRVLQHWDRFMLALPFGRGLFLAGDPIRVPPKAGETERERLRRMLETRLTELSAEADRLMGHAPIEPAPIGAEAMR